ncbi:hypothetical protein HYH02_001069 [Chlamydomonas schloesseri]|uniref:GATA-type domain-containing protein n=1 Tax=Chlamydomonas schloesseri TaxID=2026947 RepID=A0A836BCA0_9CHLO|nr:hypothetical protein HYH02_001069 [Chlamydomonas schloesseri]|eukprot:KAG2454028.1 hypothetical protein HYH02_001069 [Chlamydomonas schloesseri]
MLARAAVLTGAAEVAAEAPAEPLTAQRAAEMSTASELVAVVTARSRRPWAAHPFKERVYCCRSCDEALRGTGQTSPQARARARARRRARARARASSDDEEGGDGEQEVQRRDSGTQPPQPAAAAAATAAVATAPVPVDYELESAAPTAAGVPHLPAAAAWGPPPLQALLVPPPIAGAMPGAAPAAVAAQALAAAEVGGGVAPLPFGLGHLPWSLDPRQVSCATCSSPYLQRPSTASGFFARGTLTYTCNSCCHKNRVANGFYGPTGARSLQETGGRACVECGAEDTRQWRVHPMRLGFYICSTCHNDYKAECRKQGVGGTSARTKQEDDATPQPAGGGGSGDGDAFAAPPPVPLPLLMTMMAMGGTDKVGPGLLGAPAAALGAPAAALSNVGIVGGMAPAGAVGASPLPLPAAAHDSRSQGPQAVAAGPSGSGQPASGLGLLLTAADNAYDVDHDDTAAQQGRVTRSQAQRATHLRRGQLGGQTAVATGADAIGALGLPPAEAPAAGGNGGGVEVHAADPATLMHAAAFGFNPLAAAAALAAQQLAAEAAGMAAAAGAGVGMRTGPGGTDEARQDSADPLNVLAAAACRESAAEADLAFLLSRLQRMQGLAAIIQQGAAAAAAAAAARIGIGGGGLVPFITHQATTTKSIAAAVASAITTDAGMVGAMGAAAGVPDAHPGAGAGSIVADAGGTAVQPRLAAAGGYRAAQPALVSRRSPPACAAQGQQGAADLRHKEPALQPMAPAAAGPGTDAAATSTQPTGAPEAMASPQPRLPPQIPVAPAYAAVGANEVGSARGAVAAGATTGSTDGAGAAASTGKASAATGGTDADAAADKKGLDPRQVKCAFCSAPYARRGKAPSGFFAHGTRAYTCHGCCQENSRVNGFYGPPGTRNLQHAGGRECAECPADSTPQWHPHPERLGVYCCNACFFRLRRRARLQAARAPELKLEGGSGGKQGGRDERVQAGTDAAKAGAAAEAHGQVKVQPPATATGQPGLGATNASAAAAGAALPATDGPAMNEAAAANAAAAPPPDADVDAQAGPSQRFACTTCGNIWVKNGPKARNGFFTRGTGAFTCHSCCYKNSQANGFYGPPGTTSLEDAGGRECADCGKDTASYWIPHPSRVGFYCCGACDAKIRRRLRSLAAGPLKPKRGRGAQGQRRGGRAAKLRRADAAGQPADAAADGAAANEVLGGPAPEAEADAESPSDDGEEASPAAGSAAHGAAVSAAVSAWPMQLQPQQVQSLLAAWLATAAGSGAAGGAADAAGTPADAVHTAMAAVIPGADGRAPQAASEALDAGELHEPGPANEAGAGPLTLAQTQAQDDAPGMPLPACGRMDDGPLAAAEVEAPDVVSSPAAPGAEPDAVGEQPHHTAGSNARPQAAGLPPLAMVQVLMQDAAAASVVDEPASDTAVETPAQLAAEEAAKAAAEAAALVAALASAQAAAKPAAESAAEATAEAAAPEPLVLALAASVADAEGVAAARPERGLSPEQASATALAIVGSGRPSRSAAVRASSAIAHQLHGEAQPLKKLALAQALAAAALVLQEQGATESAADKGSGKAAAAAAAARNLASGLGKRDVRKTEQRKRKQRPAAAAGEGTASATAQPDSRRSKRRPLATAGPQPTAAEAATAGAATAPTAGAQSESSQGITCATCGNAYVKNGPNARNGFFARGTGAYTCDSCCMSNRYSDCGFYGPPGTRSLAEAGGRECGECGTEHTPQWRLHPFRTGAYACTACGLKLKRRQQQAAAAPTEQPPTQSSSQQGPDDEDALEQEQQQPASTPALRKADASRAEVSGSGLEVQPASTSETARAEAAAEAAAAAAAGGLRLRPSRSAAVRASSAIAHQLHQEDMPLMKLALAAALAAAASPLKGALGTPSTGAAPPAAGAAAAALQAAHEQSPYAALRLLADRAAAGSPIEAVAAAAAAAGSGGGQPRSLRRQRLAGSGSARSAAEALPAEPRATASTRGATGSSEAVVGQRPGPQPGGGAAAPSANVAKPTAPPQPLTEPSSIASLGDEGTLMSSGGRRSRSAARRANSTIANQLHNEELTLERLSLAAALAAAAAAVSNQGGAGASCRDSDGSVSARAAARASSASEAAAVGGPPGARVGVDSARRAAGVAGAAGVPPGPAGGASARARRRPGTAQRWPQQPCAEEADGGGEDIREAGGGEEEEEQEAELVGRRAKRSRRQMPMPRNAVVPMPALAVDGQELLDASVDASARAVLAHVAADRAARGSSSTAPPPLSSQASREGLVGCIQSWLQAHVWNRPLALLLGPSAEALGLDREQPPPGLGQKEQADWESSRVRVCAAFLRAADVAMSVEGAGDGAAAAAAAAAGQSPAIDTFHSVTCAVSEALASEVACWLMARTAPRERPPASGLAAAQRGVPLGRVLDDEDLQAGGPSGVAAVAAGAAGFATDVQLAVAAGTLAVSLRPLLLQPVREGLRVALRRGAAGQENEND